MTERCAYCGHSIALDGSMAAHLKRCRLYYPGAPTRAERLGFKAETASPNEAMTVSASPNAGKSAAYARNKRWRESHPEEYRAYQRELMRSKRAQAKTVGS